jgi:preprotein translocase subunit SecD
MQKIRVLLTVLVLLGTLAVTVNMPTRLGLDLQGGMQLILEGQDSDTIKVDDDAIMGAMEVIRNRIDSLGLTEPVIRRKGLTQIVVELPGIDNPERAVNLIGETALLEFVEGEWAPPGIENLSEEKRKILTGENARIDTIKEYDAKGTLLSERPIILRKTLLNGSLLESASPGTSEHGEPLVFIEFSKEGAQAFYEATIRNMGKPLAILLDGKIISAPNIREPIQGGRAQISGSFTIREMRDLVIKLKAGALPIPMEIVSQKILVRP